ncbi:hypothetical protein BGY98DRAFT_320842 [Russula aff. rugulosa BPL654]|nr:hypothetical protein BGY98DRAFT_320842 [Russula aff. rugulosa BPL654]
MAEESPHAPPSIARVTAPILFGPMINWALYGVLCVQTYVYSYNFRDDRRLLKIMVYFVFLLETVQTALTGADVYYWFIAGFGDLEGLKKSRFSPIDIPTMDAFISLIVQVFFCYRIWTLSKRLWWFCIVIAILSVTQTTGALWGGLKSAALGKYAVFKPSLYLWLITSAAVDILIAVTMTCLLRRSRDNENRCSHYVLPRIARLTVETNTLTTTIAIVSLALYIGFPNDIYYACPTAVIGKLYSNTLLVTLNNRIYFRDHPSLKGSSAGIGPSGRLSHHLPQVRPPGIAPSNGTISLDSFSSTTDLEKAKNIEVSNIRP